MLSRITSLGCQGVGGFGVTVECASSNGLPKFDIVGLPDAAVKEMSSKVPHSVLWQLSGERPLPGFPDAGGGSLFSQVPLPDPERRSSAPHRQIDLPDAGG